MKIAIIYNTMKDLSSRTALLSELLDLGYQVVAIAPFDGGEDRISALGVKCFDIRLSRWGVQPWREVGTLGVLWNLLKRERPDTVLAFTIKPIIYGSVAARLAGVPRMVSVVTGLGFMFVESSQFHRLKQNFASILYRLALRFNEKVLFQNRDDMELFLSRGVVAPSKAIRIPGSGVDTSFFSPRHGEGEEGYFLLVSRMLWDKGIELYVNAARRVRLKYPKARFLLVGPLDDNPAAIPAEILERWNSEGVIEYVGATHDVRSYLARCSVYVLPSFYREGIPRTNLEALAMGKPVVTTDMPGCRETVVDGENGILIPPRNEDALVEAMETFLKDPAIAIKMGAVSRKLAVDRFRSQTVHRLIIEAVKGATDRGGTQ